MVFRGRFLMIITVMVCLTMSGCELQGKTKTPADPGKKEVTRRDLFRALREHRQLLVVHGTLTPSIKQALQEFTRKLNSGSWGVKSILRSHHEVTLEDLRSTPCLIIGSPQENPWINKISNALPFSYKQGQLQFDGKNYQASTHGFVLSYYPNPYNVTLPISLISSWDQSIVEEILLQRTANRVWGGWNYEIMQGTKRVLMGDFSQQPHDRWEVVDNQKIKLPTTTVDSWEYLPYRFHTYHSQLVNDAVREFTRNCQSKALDIQEFLGYTGSLPPIDYYLYPSSEVKGLMTDNSGQSHLDFDQNQVHTVLNDYSLRRAPGMENQLLVRELLGEPQHPVLELGLSLYFSENWEESGYEYWASLLIYHNNAPHISSLLDESHLPAISPLKRKAVSASLVSFLIDHWGKEEFLERYTHWEPSSEELSALTIKWRSWVGTPPPRERVVDALPFMRGFNFTHEGYSIYNGYGSKLSVQSLQRLQQLYSNAVAVVPYTGMQDPHEARPLPFSESAGGEHDEGVIHAIRNARELGMVTMLKPQIWVRGGWPGDVEMENQAKWDQFFEHYYQWISHYALLAEMHQVDILCIGVEFSQATLKQEHHWRQLIAKIRKIYSGKLTYAANWGQEFERLGFWDELDYIGLNCYYPMSTQDQPTVAQLKKGFSRACQKVEQVVQSNKKPLLITEIGFRSVESPWKQPHEEAGDKSYHPHHQAMAYQAVMEVLQEHHLIEGIFWWKWPTVMENRGSQDRRFVPFNKPAEQVVGKYFQSMAQEKP